MLRASRVARGYESWPWPQRLPLKKDWFVHLQPGSISKDVRGVQRVGDLVVVGLLGFLAYRVYTLYGDNTYQTRLRHLNNTAPAIVAQNFDFTKGPEGARQVSREDLEKYKSEYAAARAKGGKAEDVIFKF